MRKLKVNNKLFFEKDTIEFHGDKSYSIEKYGEGYALVINTKEGDVWYRITDKYDLIHI